MNYKKTQNSYTYLNKLKTPLHLLCCFNILKYSKFCVTIGRKTLEILPLPLSSPYRFVAASDGAVKFGPFGPFFRPVRSCETHEPIWRPREEVPSSRKGSSSAKSRRCPLRAGRGDLIVLNVQVGICVRVHRRARVSVLTAGRSEKRTVRFNCFNRKFNNQGKHVI